MGKFCGKPTTKQATKYKSPNKKFENWSPYINSLNRYEIVKSLGEGSYGSVVLAKDIILNTNVALKRENLGQEIEVWKRLLREVSLLRQMRQSNYIINLQDFLIEGENDNFNTVYLVLEFGSADLHKVLKSEVYFDDFQIKKLSYNIILGMLYLHKTKVLHRDLKPSNILMNPNFDIKIIDFGLSITFAQAKLDYDGESCIFKNKTKNNESNSVEGQESQSNFQQSRSNLPSSNLDDSIIKTIQTQKPFDNNFSKKISFKVNNQNLKNLKKYSRQNSFELESYIQRQVKQNRHKDQKRKLTKHVVTRSYRAPEIVLKSSEYTNKIDV